MGGGDEERHKRGKGFVCTENSPRTARAHLCRGERLFHDIRGRRRSTCVSAAERIFRLRPHGNVAVWGFFFAMSENVCKWVATVGENGAKCTPHQSVALFTDGVVAIGARI